MAKKKASVDQPEQSDLFRSNDIQMLIEKCEKTEKASVNVRKGLFARHGQLQRDYEALSAIVDEQSREIYALKQAVFGKHESQIIQIEEIR